jgi:uncharacterized repeat protein (TIGR01451 family)
VTNRAVTWRARLVRPRPAIAAAFVFLAIAAAPNGPVAADPAPTDPTTTTTVVSTVPTTPPTTATSTSSSSSSPPITPPIDPPPGPANQCNVDGSDCMVLGVTTSSIDSNASTLFDSGDTLHVELQATMLNSATLNDVVIKASVPSGIGWTLVSNTIVVNGVGQTAAQDSDAAELVGREVRVRPFSFPALVAFDIRLGAHVDPAVVNPPVVVPATMDANDVDRPIRVSATSAVLTFTQQVADLSLRVRSLDAPEPGGNARYTFTVTNAGPSSVPDPEVTITLPAVVDTVDVPVGCITGFGVVTCRLVALGVGASDSVTIRTHVMATAALGTAYAVSGSASSSVFESQPASNTAAVDELLGSVADLSVTHRAGLIGFAGGKTSVIVNVTNAGPNRARSAVLVESFPPNLRGIGLTDDALDCTISLGTLTSPSSYRCNLGDLAPGAVLPVEFTGTLALDTPSGALPFAATVSTLASDPEVANNTSATTMTIGQAADLSVNETIPEAVFAGAPWSSTIEVRNLSGPSEARNVTVTATYGSLIVAPQATVRDGSCLTTGNQVVCTIASIAPGPNSRVEISVAATLSAGLIAGAVDSVGSDVTVTSTTVDPVPANNTTSHQAIVTSNSDLSVAITGPTSVIAGQPVSYTVVLKNFGPSEAPGATVGLVVSDTLVDLGVSSLDLPCSTTVGRVGCGRVRLAAGGSATVTVTGRTLADLPADAAVNLEATAASFVKDAKLSNNTAIFNSRVSLSPNIQVAFTSDTPQVLAGRVATYTVKVSNIGLTRSDNVVLAVNADGPTGASGSCSGSLGRMEAGASKDCTINVNVPSDTVAGQVIRVSASATATEGSKDAKETTTTVSVDNAISVTASGPGSVVAGRSVSLTYVVRNSGPSDATRVRLTIGVPSLTTVTGSGDCAISGGVVSCDIAVLRPNTDQTFTISLATDVSLDKDVSVPYSATSEPLAKGASGATAIAVVVESDLAVTSSFSPTVVAGGTTTGSFVLKNSGPSTARTVSFVVTAADVVSRPQLAVTEGQATCRSIVGRVFLCTATNLLPDASITVRLSTPTGRDTVEGTQAPYSLVLAGSDDPLAGNDRIDGTMQVLARADLAVTVNATEVVAKAGGAFKFTASMTNEGLSTAHGVVLNLELPAASLTSGIVSANGSDCLPTSLGAFVCTIGTLVPGREATVNFEGVVRRGTIDRSGLDVTVSTQMATEDTNAGNNARVFHGQVQGQTDNPSDLKLIEELGTVGNSIVLKGEVANPSAVAVSNVYVVQDVPAGQRVVAAAITRGHCDTTDRQVMCNVESIEPAGKVQMRVTTVVEQVVTDMANLTMSAFSSSVDFTEFKRDGAAFARPPIADVSDLLVNTNSNLVPLTTSTSGPLLAAVMLVLVFALGMVGWVRKGRREDPLALLGSNGIDLVPDMAGLGLSPERLDQYDRLNRLDRLNGVPEAGLLETARR